MFIHIIMLSVLQYSSHKHCNLEDAISGASIDQIHVVRRSLFLTGAEVEGEDRDDVRRLQACERSMHELSGAAYNNGLRRCGVIGVPCRFGPLHAHSTSSMIVRTLLTIVSRMWCMHQTTGGEQDQHPPRSFNIPNPVSPSAAAAASPYILHRTTLPVRTCRRLIAVSGGRCRRNVLMYPSFQDNIMSRQNL
jgi:hypothetical protein